MAADLHAVRIQHQPRATPVAKPIGGCVLEPKRPRFPGVVQKLERPMHRLLENPVTKRDFGPRDGETRTRTGDTTIFSRAVGPLERARNPCSQAELRLPGADRGRPQIPFFPRRFGRWQASHLPMRQAGPLTPIRSQGVRGKDHAQNDGRHADRLPDPRLTRTSWRERPTCGDTSPVAPFAPQRRGLPTAAGPLGIHQVSRMGSRTGDRRAAVHQPRTDALARADIDHRKAAREIVALGGTA